MLISCAKKTIKKVVGFKESVENQTSALKNFIMLLTLIAVKMSSNYPMIHLWNIKTLPTHLLLLALTDILSHFYVRLMAGLKKIKQTKNCYIGLPGQLEKLYLQSDVCWFP